MNTFSAYDTSKIESVLNGIARATNREVEGRLKRLVSARHGSMPTDDEIKAHASRRVGWPAPGWQAYFWDDHLLMAFTTSCEDGRVVLKVNEPSPP